MKKLAVGMMLVAALLLGVTTAAPVLGGSIDTNYTIGDGTTTWVDTTSGVGSYSLELYWPKPGSHYAGVRLYDLGDPLVKDFASWSYWANAPEDYIPNFVISLDTPLANYTDKDYDTNVNIWPRNDGHGDEWLLFQSTSELPYVVWQCGSGSPVMKTMSWSEFQQPCDQWGNSYDFSEATIKQVRVWNGGIGTNQTITAYLDDIALDGVTYSLETAPIPEPACLGLIAFGLIPVIRRRRS